VTDRPVRPPRAETRDVVELKAIKASHPELASAVDMQLELVEAQRRVKARVPLPWIQPEPAWLESQQRAGRSAVRFGDIPLEWSDFRLALRQTADILYRHDAMDRADHDQILALSRDGNALAPLVTQWYFATSRAEGSDPETRVPAGAAASLDQVLVLSLRPFLARCAEALLPRPEFAAWRYGHCPICGWEPDFAVITPNADRHLICGRCLGQWTFDPINCPFCANDDRARITSFASRDGRYRVYACDVCRKYLKAYDARNASRPVMVAVDTIATLPLDAAAIQKGYDG
jgi:Protein involved in formate dehydrogenase formation